MSSYTLSEAFALVQRRLGMKEVRRLQQELLPVVDVFWVDGELHDAGVTAMLAANRRELSLVDCVSFELMRRFGVRQALAFDEHFRERGFELPSA